MPTANFQIGIMQCKAHDLDEKWIFSQHRNIRTCQCEWCIKICFQSLEKKIFFDKLFLIVFSVHFFLKIFFQKLYDSLWNRILCKTNVSMINKHKLNRFENWISAVSIHVAKKIHAIRCMLIGISILRLLNYHLSKFSRFKTGLSFLVKYILYISSPIIQRELV